MRWRPFLLILVNQPALVAACAGSDDVLEGTPYEVHLPPGYRPREHAPLLVLLHGYGQTGESVSAYFDVLPVTDTNRMLVVAPTAPPTTGASRWTPPAPAAARPTRRSTTSATCGRCSRTCDGTT